MRVGVTRGRSFGVIAGAGSVHGRGLLCASLLAATALSSPGFAAVLPTGGKVVAGSAMIGAPQAGSLTISQSSAKAIIDWNGFSIGKGSAVSFANGRGATLNRVTGAAVSNLDGLLSATGSVYVINPNGVIIGRSGVVSVGGSFVASTLDVSNANFLGGGALSFTGLSNAAVVNYGKIGALGGDVALIAAKVSNTGEIDAATGDAGLLAGYKVVLTDASLDGGRFAVELGAAGTSATNAGLIQAADAELRAEGGNVYALAGDTGGVIRATGVKSGGGKVWLVADGGTLQVAGVLEAQGAGGASGSIETSGATVKIGAAAIDAHGGRWLVDPDDLTIDVAAANTIDNALNAGTSVTEQTTATGTSGSGTVNTAGNGDIIVAAPLTWTTNAALTLSALRNVTLNPASLITSTGGGAVTLQADNTGTGVGTVNFGLASGVSTSGAVTIFYNPVSYSDAATKSTQSYGGGGQDSRNYANPYTSDVSGGGTLLAYMLVNNLTQLEGLSTELDGVYALTHDLDATSSATMNPIAGGGYAGWTPIGTSNNGGTVFTGSLNGQGHIINGLYINTTTNGNGLFGDIGLISAITNLGLTNVNITSTGQQTGALAGYKDGYGELTNVYATGTVSGGFVTGGLVAELNGGINTNIYANVKVGGTDVRTGGLVGQFDNGALTNAYATGSVTGTGLVGGLIGFDAGDVTITNAYATGNVAGVVTGNNTADYIGGFVGLGGSATITNAYATGNVTTTQAGIYIGGFAGQYDGAATNIHAAGNIASAGASVGGLIGYVARDATVTDAFATGSVSTTGQNVGGFVGLLAGVVTDSYASGAVSGSGYVGGFVGGDVISFSPSVTDSYATGSVTGVQSADASVINDVGGFAGDNTHAGGGGAPVSALTRDYATGLVSGAGVLAGFAGQNDGTIVNSLWDRTSTGQTTAVGAANSANLGTGVVTNLTSVQDTTPGAADYAFSTAPYTAAGFSFGTTPGGTVGLAGGGETWVQVDADGGFNGAGGATVGTRPFLLMEYSPTITNAHQLQLMDLAVGANYTLTANVDASATATTAGMWGPNGFIPVGQDTDGTTATQYTGTFNGNGLSLLGLTVTSASNNVGLFGVIGAAGVAENLDLVGGAVTSTGAGNGPQSHATVYVGNLSGENLGTVQSVNASAPVSVTGAYAIATGGGVVGLNTGAILLSNASGPVSLTNLASTSTLGGLVGSSTGSVQMSSASGTITGVGTSAGLIGMSTGPVSNSSASGAIASDGISGGLIGNSDGPVSNSHASGDISPSNYGGPVGGLIGRMTSTVTDSYATGSIAAAGLVYVSQEIGGLVGFLTLAAGSKTPGSVIDSYATGHVSGDEYVGGLVGLADSGASITGSRAGLTYASGDVVGGSSVGGLAGQVTGSVTLASASGTVTEGGLSIVSDDYGGLVGELNGTLTGGSASGSVSGAVVVGGLVGSLAGTVISSSASGAVTAYGSAVYNAPPVAVAGGLVGYLGVMSQISGSSALGMVNGEGAFVGGLVGRNVGSVISDSFATGVVSGTTQVGGLVGESLNDTTSNPGTTYTASITGSAAGKTYATGAVTGTGTSTGGLVGENQGAITQAAYDVSGGRSVQGVTGAADVGGAVGLNEAGATLSNVSVFSGVVGTSYTGGVVGDNFGAVTGGGYSGAVSGASGVGGIVGVNEGGASITGTGGFQGNNTVVGTGNDVGGVAGANFGTLGSSIARVNSADSVTGVDHVGGLVGYNSGILVGTASGVVSGRNYVGGLVGLNYASIVGNASGAVNGADYVGGAVGWNDAQGSVFASSSVAYVTATGDYAGGLAGVNKGTVTKSAVGPANAIVGSVTGTGYVGGLVGLNQGTITQSFSLVPATGNLYVGGLVGWNDTGATIKTSYATGTVTGIAGGQDTSGNDYVGGLVGVNFGSIADTYATGAISGVQVVGGLVGTNMPGGASVTTSYATGPVTASKGAVGSTFGVQAGEVTSVYGFPALSGQALASGYYNTPSAIGDGTGLSPAQEDGSAAYVGFDFTNTWQANSDGPPTLQSPAAN